MKSIESELAKVEAKVRVLPEIVNEVVGAWITPLRDTNI